MTKRQIEDAISDVMDRIYSVEEGESGELEELHSELDNLHRELEEFLD